MNRRFVAGWALATAAISTVVGFIAYNAGQASHVVTTTGGDGRVFYPGYYGFGFFPFFGIFWILLIGFLLFRLFFWRPWRGGGWGPGHGYYWHEHPVDQGGSGNPPATPSQPGGGQPQQTASA